MSKEMVFGNFWCNLFGYQSNEASEDDYEMTVILGYLLLPFLGFVTVWLRKEIFSRYLIPVGGVHLPDNFLICCPRIASKRTVVGWAQKRLPKQWSSKLGTLSGGIGDFWKDGSLLCTLINSAIPGACSNPYRHWMSPPMHAQEVVYKYLGIAPIFSEEDFSSHLTPRLERRLLNYLVMIYKFVYALEKDKIFLKIVGSKFVAKGMGLYTAEQSKEAEFFIYSKYNKIQFFNLQIEIRGPHLSYYKTNVLDYLANEFICKDYFKKSASNISLKIDIEKDRLRIVYVSKFGGIHEINISSNNEIVVGSPFYVNVMSYTLTSKKEVKSLHETETFRVDTGNEQLSKGYNTKSNSESNNLNNNGKCVLGKVKPLKISKYLKNLNMLNNQQLLTGYKKGETVFTELKPNFHNCFFSDESYSCFQKFANSCFRIPCKITRASPVFCSSHPTEFCSASPVCRKHIDPEDFGKQESAGHIQEHFQTGLPPTTHLKQRYTLDRSFLTLKNTKGNLNQRNQLTKINALSEDKLVQAKKLFWERAFNSSDDSQHCTLKSDKQLSTIESKALSKTASSKSQLYSKLKHVDSLFLLRKRPVSKSLSDWRNENKKLQARRSLDGNLDLCSKVSLENRLNNYINHVQLFDRDSESEGVNESTTKKSFDFQPQKVYQNTFEEKL